MQTALFSPSFKERFRENAYVQLLRLNHPTGFLLVLWPALWSLIMASYDLFYHWQLYFQFILGGIVMRSAGCIVNDLWDRHIDAQVERTKRRPIASGRIKPLRALLIAFGLALVGLYILLQLPDAAFYTGLIFALPIVLYPLARRYIPAPQLVLGFTFNAGALLGWLAIREEFSLAALLLYLACIFWTLGYDTIYGHQDKYDDARLGLGSMALLLGNDTRFFTAVFYAIFIILLGVSGHLAGLSMNFLIGLGFAVSQLIWQVRTLNIHNPSDCAVKFKSNGWLGIIIFLAIIAGQFEAL